jgi:hypothetical protein
MKRTRRRRNTPEYWWIYALLLSTMILSLINLVIGGAEDIAHILINRLLHRTLLVPDIEAILSGRHSKGMMLEELTRATPSAWEDPAKVLGWVISDRRLKTLLQRP